MIFIKNKYTDLYYKIIQHAKIRKIIPNEYYENHHIIPESFYKNRVREGPIGWLDGNPNDKVNRIKLTAREHFVCHKLLVRMTDGPAKKKMIFGLWSMCRAGSKQNRYNISSREYALLRQQFVKNITETNTGKQKKPLSDEHKQKLSNKTKNIPKSELTKNKMIAAWSDRDRTVSESTKKLLSKSSSLFWKSDTARYIQSVKRKKFLENNPHVVAEQITRINSIKICEFCNKSSNIGNYFRWHGVNCKLNKWYRRIKITKKLAELFELPEEEIGDLKIPIPEYAEDVTMNALDTLEKIENALPQVRGLEASDIEMDELANLATSSYKDLFDLGMQVDSRFASEIFNSASSMLGHAITAKTAKLNKKLKMIDLQLKKAQLDQKIASSTKEIEATPVGEGSLLDRNEILKSILASKKTQ